MSPDKTQLPGFQTPNSLTVMRGELILAEVTKLTSKYVAAHYHIEAFSTVDFTLAIECPGQMGRVLAVYINGEEFHRFDKQYDFNDEVSISFNSARFIDFNESVPLMAQLEIVWHGRA